jgi:putative peptidoglycan lipid II flippase
LVSVGTLLSRITGLARVSVTLAALGLTTLSDAYNAANATPNIVYELILGGILTSVFVPILVDWAKTHGQDASWEAASRFLTLAAVSLTAVAVAGAVAAPWIMRAYLAGVEPARQPAAIATGTVFLRWFMPQIVFYGIGAVAGGILTANRKYAAQMFAPILNNLAVIVTMLVFIASRGASAATAELTTGQRTLLGLGTTMGVVAMTLALWPALRSAGFRFRPRFDWAHETVKSLIRLGKWVAIYVAANQTAYMVIIYVANRVDEGAYTAYSQAFVFFSLPHAIVAVSIFTVLLPGLAEAWTANDREGVREQFSRGFRDTQVMMIPAAAGLLVLANPIVSLLAGYGAVGEGDLDVLARTLAGFAVGLPFFSAFQLLTRAFYAGHDARTPALVNLTAALINLAANALFAFGLGLGVAGLALGHAVSYVFGSVALFVLLRSRLGGVDGARIGLTVAKALGAAALTALAAWGTATALNGVVDVTHPPLRALQVAGAVLAGMLVFFGTALILRVGEVEDLRTALSPRKRGSHT